MPVVIIFWLPQLQLWLQLSTAARGDLCSSAEAAQPFGFMP
jgi:hypothetical protein